MALSNTSILVIVLVVIAAVALLFFLIRRNNKDITYMNPDQEETADEVKGDQERRREEM